MDFETADPTDDIRVTFSDGRKAFISAKRKVTKGSPLAQTVMGWIGQAAALGENDLLVIAGEEFTGPMRHLDHVLRRHRKGLPMETERERITLNILTELIPADVLDVVLDRARVLEVPGATGAGAARALQAALMDFAVVGAQGQQAVIILTDLFHRQAGGALGSDINEWVCALNNAGLAVIENNAGPAGMRIAARLSAVAAYKDRLAAEMGRIDLTLLAEDLAPLTVDNLVENLRISVDGEHGDTDLLSHVRRLRRMLIVGQPGAGKSVALREIASHCVMHARAPIPVSVVLPRLLEQQPERFTVTGLIGVSVADVVDADQRACLAEYLLKELEAGRAIILCDGLDECGARAAWAAQQLAEVLESLPARAGFILTTRANTQVAAIRMGLVTAELAPPEHLGATVDAILNSCAEARVPAVERAAWLATRRAWISEAEHQHAELLRVPLLAVLVALICADTSDAELPKGRAILLHRAVERSVSRWEQIRRATDQARPWSPILTSSMLLDGFVVLGRLLDGGATVTREQALGEVTRLLHDPDCWRMAPAQAREIGEQVLRFWDERVAVFVVNAADKLTNRSRVFAEIATAMWASTCSVEDLNGWLAAAVEYTDSDGAIGLAAGLDPRIIATLLHLGESGKHHLALLVAELAERGIVTLTAEESDRTLALIAAGIDAICGGEPAIKRGPKRPQKSAIPKVASDIPTTWPFVQAACLLTLPARVRPRRVELIARASLDERSTIIAAALCALSDSTTDSQRLDQDAVLAVEAGLNTALPQKAATIKTGRRRFSLAKSERLAPGLDRVALGASYRLDELAEGASQKANRIANRAGWAMANRILAVLVDAGVDADTPWSTFQAQIAPLLATYKRRQASLLDDLDALAPPSNIPAANDAVWSMTDLGALLEATNYRDGDSGEIDRAITCDTVEVRRGWLAAIADAYGLDKTAIADQARHIRQVGTEGGYPAEFREWAVVLVDPQEEPQQVANVSSVLTADQLHLLLTCLEAESDWIAWAAGGVLINVSDSLWNNIELFDKDMSAWPRSRAGLTYMVAILSAGNDRDNLLTAAAESESADYRFAARLAISTSELDPDGSVMDSLCRDDDLSVRPESARTTTPLPTLWSCNLCRSVNDTNVENCTGCSKGVRPWIRPQ
ncbi:NACHT domain-containing protein [Nocardia salmonicida]|uniref:NACHT domain-containing protein n=1 Tax=Nocardia salmonicida TaxID=53431 RepID=UPI001C3FDC4A|nr:hypothetical protein [Nocardia salmonicida]